MTSQSNFSNLPSLSLGGQSSSNGSLMSPASRLATKGFNAVQMALFESYINGLEVPDSMLISLFDFAMPLLFKRYPSLLASYDWVLKETDHLAEGGKELMKIQYDLPQQMLNLMLGDYDVIYPKYSMGFWQSGAKKS